MPGNPQQDLVVQQAIAARQAEEGPLLPILHDIQDTLGFVPKESVPLVAKALNLTRAEVHGVVTFYHHYRMTPPGQHVVRVCRAESCQAVGADALVEHAKRSLGIDFHETTPDGHVTLEPVYCLGQCACSPAIMVGDEVHGLVTPERFDAIVNALEKSQ